MCWSSNELNPLISDGNVKVIKVCKIINGKICGYFFQNFQYELGKEYQSEIYIFPQNGVKSYYFGSTGLHSYSADKCTIGIYTNCLGSYHFQARCHALQNCIVHTFGEATCNCAVFEGYIPKGKTYYINRVGEIISESIVLTKKLNQICVGNQMS